MTANNEIRTLKTMGNDGGEITVFYACDDRYIPYLSVSVRSLIEHASASKRYRVVVLHNGLNKENIVRVRKMATKNVRIAFRDVCPRLRAVANSLKLRDYYSLSIYFRLFIPRLFPRIDKAIYLDADTVVLSDVAELYAVPLRRNLTAAVPDAVIASERAFIRYAEEGVGVAYDRYFNSGVMLMNLSEMRRRDLEGTFVRLLKNYNFNTVCPDQDYLNVICKDRVHYLSCAWNRMTVDPTPCAEPKIIHYNNFFKPWHYDGVPYGDAFWKFAEMSPYYSEILSEKENFGALQQEKDRIGVQGLFTAVNEVIEDPANFKKVLFTRKRERKTVPVYSVSFSSDEPMPGAQALAT